MNPVYDKLLKCYDCYKAKIDFEPKVAVVLGSGLGNFAKVVDVKAELPYSEIEGFPVSTVPGHAGKFIFGYINEVPVVLMQGAGTLLRGISDHGRGIASAADEDDGCESAFPDECFRRHQSGVSCGQPDADSGSHFPVCAESADRTKY